MSLQPSGIKLFLTFKNSNSIKWGKSPFLSISGMKESGIGKALTTWIKRSIDGNQ